VLSGIIARADVFIQNLAPGAVDRLGYAPALLRERHPRLITVSISGYGDEGPLRDLKAYDLLVQAESGLSSITGTPEGMTRVGVSVCDIAAGMTAYQAVLEALIGRDRTGKGRHVAVSLFHALGDWMNVPYLQFAYGGKTLERNGLVHPTIAPYGAYAGSDGREVLLSIQNEREWAQFCAIALGRPEVAADPRFDGNTKRVANRAALDAIIHAVFATLPRDAIVRRLDAAKVAYGRVSTMEDLVNHPQNRYVEVETPSGPVRMLAPGALADGAPRAPGPVPALGQHTQAILAEFGPAGRA
jgi:crotonobetainyl-CoA:carnitine CoA-transferase CaiB-like acyl-CoA transferase